MLVGKSYSRRQHRGYLLTLASSATTDWQTQQETLEFILHERDRIVKPEDH
jgi:hypothetical protein